MAKGNKGAAKGYDRRKPHQGGDELLRAVQETLYASSDAGAPEESGDGAPELDHKTREELYRLARQRRISGRSDMKKTDLIGTLKRDMGQSPRPSVQ